MPVQFGRVDLQRLMVERTDPDPVPMITEIYPGVVVANDGQRGFAFGVRSKFGDRRGDHILVLERDHGQRQANHLSDRRSPHTGATDDDVCRQNPTRSAYPRNPPAGVLDAQHFLIPGEGRTSILSQTGLRFHGPKRHSQPLIPRCERSQKLGPVDDRPRAHRLLGSDHLPLPPPSERGGTSALQFEQSILRERHFKRSHRMSSRGAVQFESAELRQGVVGECLHHLRRAGATDQPWSVGGGSPSGVEGPFVQDRDGRLTQCGEFVGQGGADDARADDDDPSTHPNPSWSASGSVRLAHATQEELLVLRE